MLWRREGSGHVAGGSAAVIVHGFYRMPCLHGAFPWGALQGRAGVKYLLGLCIRNGTQPDGQMGVRILLIPEVPLGVAQWAACSLPQPVQAPLTAPSTYGMRAWCSHRYRSAAQVGLETDTADILNEIIYCCRKGGTIACIGVYVGTTNGFNIGAFMEKGLTMKAGQTPVQVRVRFARQRSM